MAGNMFVVENDSQANIQVGLRVWGIGFSAVTLSKISAGIA